MKRKLAVENLLCYPRGKTSPTNIKHLNSLYGAQAIQLLPILRRKLKEDIFLVILADQRVSQQHSCQHISSNQSTGQYSAYAQSRHFQFSWHISVHNITCISSSSSVRGTTGTQQKITQSIVTNKTWRSWNASIELTKLDSQSLSSRIVKLQHKHRTTRWLLHYHCSNLDDIAKCSAKPMSSENGTSRFINKYSSLSFNDHRCL